MRAVQSLVDWVLGVIVLLSATCYASIKNKTPHIVFILADDLGWNDVGFHGANEIWTPNIDALAYSGVILNSHYSQSLCTPSRAALLTGRYPIHTGTQHNVILEASPWGVPLEFKMMPEYLKKLGYESHALGKWHLGFYKKQYTPTFRGFKSHYGFWNGYQDYFSHIVQASFSPFEGFDMRRNLEVDWSSIGKYTTRILTSEAESIISKHNTSVPLFLYFAHAAVHAGNYEFPLQAPPRTLELFKHIKSEDRRLYAAMLWELDQSVGRVVSALKKRHMLDNTIIVFVSDNGAATAGLHKNTGSNFPFKGEKATPWEGGVRTSAVIWSKNIRRKGLVLNDLVHITDWLPTLFTAAGGNAQAEMPDIDGRNQWAYINGFDPDSNRHEILHNIDDLYKYSSLRVGPYKYVNGSSLLGFLDNWVGIEEDPSYSYNVSAVLGSDVNFHLGGLQDSTQISSIREQAIITCPSSRNTRRCFSLKQPCLFNIRVDPCERNNIYQGHRPIVRRMEAKIAEYRKTMRQPGNKRVESIADPDHYNHTWVNWGDLPGYNDKDSVLL